MPDKHWVLVAERRGKPTSERHREIIYATDNEAKARRDAELFGKSNKRMRYYVMRYDQIVKVAEGELAALEQALADAREMESGGSSE